jgi:hypothetical protein
LEDCVDFGKYVFGQAKLLEKTPKPQRRFSGKQRSTRIRHWGITLNNLNERGSGHNGIHLFQKDPLAGLIDCDLEAAIGKVNLFQVSILSPQRLERLGFADSP